MFAISCAQLPSLFIITEMLILESSLRLKWGISKIFFEDISLKENFLDWVLVSWLPSHYGRGLEQGSPRATNWYQATNVRNGATQKQVSNRQASEGSSVFPATPHHSHYCLSSTSCQVSGSMINAMHVNHSETTSAPQGPWKNCLTGNCPLVPKELGTTGLEG